MLVSIYVVQSMADEPTCIYVGWHCNCATHLKCIVNFAQRNVKISHEMRNIFYVTPSIFGGHFKVFKHLIPKHLWHSRNLWDGFTNVVSVLRDLLFPFQRTAGKVKILQGDESTTHTNLEKMFSHLLGVLREKYGPTTTFLNLEVHLVDSWILQLNVKRLNDKWLNN